jgi:hypothetical protein
MLELVSCPIHLCHKVTFDESPIISLWPSGSLCAESRISTSFPVKLSVIFFPQSVRASFMMMLFSISLFSRVTWSPMFPSLLKATVPYLLGSLTFAAPTTQSHRVSSKTCMRGLANTLRRMAQNGVNSVKIKLFEEVIPKYIMKGLSFRWSSEIVTAWARVGLSASPFLILFPVSEAAGLRRFT